MMWLKNTVWCYCRKKPPWNWGYLPCFKLQQLWQLLGFLVCLFGIGFEVDLRRCCTSLAFSSILNYSILNSDKKPVFLALKVRLVPASLEDPEFQSTFAQSATLFAKYQMAIHKDTPAECNEHQVQFPACSYYWCGVMINSNEYLTYQSSQQTDLHRRISYLLSGLMGQLSVSVKMYLMKVVIKMMILKTVRSLLMISFTH